ncbi:MAG: hypothetical protein AAGF01_16590, partial [Cyanobacteria bacterium P01_G01_bin.38]
MFYLPVGFLLFLAFILLLPFIVFGLTLDVVELAVAKLGFSTNLAFLLLAAVVIGGMINIPLYQRESTVTAMPQD